VNVVFMDNDIFVFKSLARIFENEDFDYGCTISDSKAMPVRFQPVSVSDAGITPAVSHAGAASRTRSVAASPSYAGCVGFCTACTVNMRWWVIPVQAAHILWHARLIGAPPVRRSTSACSSSRLGAMWRQSGSWKRSSHNTA